MKKILLNLGNSFFCENKTGIGTYHKNIIFSIEQDFYITITNEAQKKYLPKNAKPILVSKHKSKIISLFKWFLPVECFFYGFDIVLTDSFSFYSLKSKTKLIMLVHDCMSFTEPKNYRLSAKLYLRISSLTFKHSTKIIAVSQITKQTLHTLFKIPYEKIFVIPNITDFYLEKKSKNPKKDFLYIGDMRKTKNLEFLIKGFCEYKNKFDSKEKLIIAGNKKNEYEKLLKLTQKLNLTNYVIFPGYISETEKQNYFNSAKAFIFLSDNEGFGIPLLEACVNKIPVLCSDIPVFHEVLNENLAIFINNKDEKEIANGLKEISQKKLNSLDCEKLKNYYSIENFSKKINDLLRE